jgi:hypothetical protein
MCIEYSGGVPNSRKYGREKVLQAFKVYRAEQRKLDKIASFREASKDSIDEVSAYEEQS